MTRCYRHMDPAPLAVHARREREKARRVTLARNTCPRLEPALYFDVGSSAWLAYWSRLNRPSVDPASQEASPLATAAVLSMLPGGRA